MSACSSNSPMMLQETVKNVLVMALAESIATTLALLLAQVIRGHADA